MIAELILSEKKCGFNKQDLKYICRWLLERYGKFEISTGDDEILYELMTHDKKNEGNRINFTLLSKTGTAKINQNCSKALIFEALDEYKNLRI